MAARAISIIFEIYSWLIIIRILLSWTPVNNKNEFIKQLYNITDPYLNLFRKVIPPIGMVDISPIAAIMVLEVIKRLIVQFLPY